MNNELIAPCGCRSVYEYHDGKDGWPGSWLIKETYCCPEHEEQLKAQLNARPNSQ